MNAKGEQNETRTFLETLFGKKPDDLFILIWTKHNKLSKWFKTVEEALPYVESVKNNDTYVGMGLAPASAAGDAKKRCKANDIAAITALYCDVDVAGDGHKKTGLPPTTEAALALVNELPCGPPTMIVNSGHGLHAHWVLDKPWILSTPEENAAAQAFSGAFGDLLGARATFLNYSIDSVFDLSRVLRVPGTRNRKLPGEEVWARILECNPERRYSREEIGKFLGGFKLDEKPKKSKAADAAPVVSGDLVLNPMAEPPEEKFDQLRQIDPGFLQVWKMKAANLPSASEHDYSLAIRALRVNWTHQEVADLIIAFRRANNIDTEKALRPDYVTGTINRALKTIQQDKEREEQPGANLTEDEARELLQALTGAEDRRKAVIEAMNNTTTIGSLALVADKYLHIWEATIEGLRADGVTARTLDALAKSVRTEKRKLRSLRAVRRDEGHEVQSEKESDRQQIITNNRQHITVVEEVERELAKVNAKSPCLFLRNGDLIRVVVDEKNRPGFKMASEDWLRRRCSEVADFIHIQENGIRAVSPPLEVVKSIKAEGEKCGAFPVVSITESPILRDDGSIITEPGYDKATKIYYHPAPGFTLPEISAKPTKEEAAAAARLLLDELFCDFPFVDEASKSNLLGALVTVATRHLINGPVPLFCISSTTWGTGKGLLSEIISLVVTGNKASADNDKGRNEAEWEKTLFSKLFRGRSVILFDNVSTTLESDKLCSAITIGSLDHRIFGLNTECKDVENRAIFFVNGNNLQVGGDLPRRCVWSKMEPKMPDPYLRTNFKHDQIMDWIKGRRGELLAAVLTMGRGWIVAGKPPASGKVPRIGSFERWSNMIGGILEFAGVDGFLENYRAMIEVNDTDREEWEAFLTAWKTVHGRVILTVGALVDHIVGPDGAQMRDALPSQLDWFSYAEERSSGLVKRLGLALRKIEGRRHGKANLRIKKVPYYDTHNKQHGWRVEEGD